MPGAVWIAAVPMARWIGDIVREVAWMVRAS
jgi:hypothetical protein